MNVGELINKLKSYPPDWKIFVETYMDGECPFVGFHTNGDALVFNYDPETDTDEDEQN